MNKFLDIIKEYHLSLLYKQRKLFQRECKLCYTELNDLNISFSDFRKLLEEVDNAYGRSEMQIMKHEILASQTKIH